MRRFAGYMLMLCCLWIGGLPEATAARQTPEATPPAPFMPWQVTESRELKVDGQLLAISPNGTRIAGIGPEGDAICVWEVETLDATCAGDSLKIQHHPLRGGLAWAPDSSAVAFITGDWQRFEPTDVMLFDIEHGWLRNLTQTVQSDALLIHTGPAWTHDSSRVVYAQTDPAASDEPPATIFYYDRQFSAALPVPMEDAFSIYAPVVVLPDDSVLFRVDLAPMGTENAGIWRVDANGENLQQILAGEENAPIDRPVVIDVSADGAWMVVASESAMARLAFDEAFHFVAIGSGDVQPADLGEDGEVVSQPVFAPGVAVALLQDAAIPGGISLALVAPSTGEVWPIEGMSLPDSWLRYPATWAPGGQVLIPTDDGGVLLAMSSGED